MIEIAFKNVQLNNRSEKVCAIISAIIFMPLRFIKGQKVHIFHINVIEKIAM